MVNDKLEIKRRSNFQNVSFAELTPLPSNAFDNVVAVI